MSDDTERIVFYMAPRTRSMTVHWMLEEVGAPYRNHVLDLEAGEHKRAAYLAINPMGKVPALVHGDTVITEVAAICLYLADAFPAADVVFGSGVRWALYMKLLPEQPALTAYAERLGERPALQRAMTQEATMASATSG